MKIFYELSNFCWNFVEENFKNTDIDVWCVEADELADYEYVKNKTANRKCIYFENKSFYNNILEGIITYGRFRFNIIDSFRKLKNQFVLAIGKDKDIIILIEDFYYQKGFLEFFRELKSEMNLNLHIIAQDYIKDCESETYHQLLRQVPCLNNFSSACIFNCAELSDILKIEYMIEADKIICSELPKIIRKLREREYRGFAVYNHKNQNYERFYIPDEYMIDEKISDNYFYETVSPMHDKKFCNRLKEYKKEFAKKYNMRYKMQVCNYDKPCKGTCLYCENEATEMWEKVYKRKKVINQEFTELNGIERLRENTDGSGIRSLVLIGGCPLNCKYCGNAEYRDIFIGSKEFSVSELGERIKKDGIYFEQSGGGVTFGGGEPLLSSEFILNFCKIYDMWNVDIETSLNADFCHVQRLVDCIDVWHIDIKDMNPDIYISYTGNDNSRVISNLNFLIKKVSPEKLHIRVPEIPDFNSESDIKKSVEALRKMGFTNIEIFKYKV